MPVHEDPTPELGTGAVWCGCYPEWEWMLAGILVVIVVCSISFISFVIGCLFTRYVDQRALRAREVLLQAATSSSTTSYGASGAGRVMAAPGIGIGGYGHAGPERGGALLPPDARIKHW